jgi:hypothetical protein
MGITNSTVELEYKWNSAEIRNMWNNSFSSCSNKKKIQWEPVLRGQSRKELHHFGGTVAGLMFSVGGLSKMSQTATVSYVAKNLL